jgi:peptide/nickel transport system substrate-binding protein
MDEQIHYPCLVSYDYKANKFLPGLAKKWTTSSNGLVWTFSLRAGGWSDGQPITAKDMTFTLDKAIPVIGGYGYFGGNYASWRAIDDSTFELTLKSPDNTALNGLLFVGVLPEHVFVNSLKDAKSAAAAFDQLPVVSGGPYALTKVTGDTAAEFAANPHYFGGAPETKRLGVRLYGTFDVLLLALEHGEIDLIPQASNGSFDAASLPSSVHNTTGPGLNWNVLYFNMTSSQKYKELFDLKVRQAVALAIDRKALSTSGYRGLAKPQGSIFPAGAGSWLDPSIPIDEYNPTMSNSILDAAGYARGSDGVRVANGHPMHYELMVHGQGTAPQVPPLLKQQLAAIGITIDPKTVDQATFGSQLFATKYTIACSNDGYAGIALTYLGNFASGGGVQTVTGYASSDLFDSVHVALTSQTPSDATAAAFHAQQILYRDRPLIPLVTIDAISLSHTKVAGLIGSPTATPCPETMPDWVSIQVQT